MGKKNLSVMSLPWLFTYILMASRHLRCKPDLFTFSLVSNLYLPSNFEFERLPAELTFCVFVCLYECLFFHLSICPFVHLSICLFVHLSICPFVDLSVCPLVHWSVCSFVHLSVCPFIFYRTGFRIFSFEATSNFFFQAFER